MGGELGGDLYMCGCGRVRLFGVRGILVLYLDGDLVVENLLVVLF